MFDALITINFVFILLQAPGESRIPIFCHTGVKAPLTTRLSRPLVNLSSKVRAHLTGSSSSGSCSGENKAARLTLNLPLSPTRPDLSLGQLSEPTSQQEDTAIWCAVEGVRYFRKDDTPTMASTNSKHGSFELDESLGILTPDQMAESPLCDELPSLLLMSEDYQGYQGDGECSRPASPGKPNPMTDSDFFTESDADMHEELHTHSSQPPLSGDRKAQVIDGRLYGCSSQQVPAGCPSFLAAEEMDSSGVYSDTDRTPRPEPEEENDEYSPAKLSTLIMEQVNTIKNLVVSVPMEDEAISCDMEETSDNQNPPCDPNDLTQDNKTASPPPAQQTPSPHQEDSESSAPATKKHKMPKRNVVSKIKTMISSSSSQNKEKPQEERRPRRATGCSRWDAVMNKIAQGQAEAGTRPSLKQVKSRVFAGMSAPPTRGPLPNSRKASTQQHAPPPLKTKRYITLKCWHNSSF